MFDRKNECKTFYCTHNKDGKCTKIVKRVRLKCDKKHCMCNTDGYCAHTKCPMTNPEYKSPEKVADEVERQMQDQLRIERELRNQVAKTKNN